MWIGLKKIYRRGKKPPSQLRPKGLVSLLYADFKFLGVMWQKCKREKRVG